MSYGILDQINSPHDLKQLNESQLQGVVRQLRQYIIDVVAQKGGHLGASLGVVELTVALHKVFNTPQDPVVWDVGHQAYGHKILTGRREAFMTIRDFEGVSGFPKMEESPYDAFGTGHSSTSISAVMGMAMASKINGSLAKHIAIIGDASIASGMAFEALNHLGVSDCDVLVILNDNAIGIDPSVGALKNYLTHASSGKTSGQDNIFESLNLDYTGPIDGHDLNGLCSELERQKSLQGPRLLHVKTVKGKGLKQAEIDQVRYHAPGKFDSKTGNIESTEQGKLPPKFQDVFGHTIVELAKQNKKIVGITPAMPTGSSMKMMIDEMPDRAFDVGIAEQHAVTLSAGMATGGLIPFCNIYSTFLQRAYDQIIHDVALQKLPVIFCLDRAGLVGKDGPTHHGVYDLAYLNCVPDLIITAPMNAVELRNMMYTAQLEPDLPIAIRYPRGRCQLLDWKQPFAKIELGKSQSLSQGSKLAVLTLGPLGMTVQNLIKEQGLEITHLDMRYLKPIDEQALDKVFTTHQHIITMEDGTVVGGLGSVVMDYAFAKAYTGKISKLGIPDKFIPHGPTDTLQEVAGISREQILDAINQAIAAL
ncbi:MAG: 1-deoxy-D-xylulose-5-phosphate synthase [Nonlabens sp.]